MITMASMPERKTTIISEFTIENLAGTCERVLWWRWGRLLCRVRVNVGETSNVCVCVV